MSNKKFGNKKTFNKTNIKKIEDAPGVYKLNNAKGKTIYVGKAKNRRIQDRLLGHLNRKDIPGVATVQILITKNQEEALKNEKSLIKKIQPKYNDTHKN